MTSRVADTSVCRCPHVRKSGTEDRDIRTDSGPIYRATSVRPYVPFVLTPKVGYVRKCVRKSGNVNKL